MKNATASVECQRRKVLLDVDAKIHWFRVLIKAFLVKKKGTKTAVLSRVAKFRSVVPLLHR